MAPMARPHGQSRLPVANAPGTKEAFVLEGEPLWYQDAIIYEVHVRGFYDRDGDGVGDVRGLAENSIIYKISGSAPFGCSPFTSRP
jgi:maltose alpha-D-glucosyltransferase/alpha-amylase